MKMFRVSTYVPRTHSDAVRDAIGSAGGGTIGKYSHCSFSMGGTGRFIPLEGSNPALGTKGKLEEVPEDRIEFYCPENLLETVAKAIRTVHPYGEVPIDASEIKIL